MHTKAETKNLFLIENKKY